MSQEMLLDGGDGGWLRTVGRGSASRKRTDGCESRRGGWRGERQQRAEEHGRCGPRLGGQSCQRATINVVVFATTCVEKEGLV